MAFIKKIKKLKKSVKITGGVIIGVIVVFAIFSFYYRDKWYPNTSINGIDVSSMTYEESKNVLKNQIESYALEIGAEGNQKLTIAGKDINLSADFEKNLESDYKNHRSQRSIFGIFSDISDKHLEEMLNTYNNYLLNWINWDMGEGKVETMTPDDIKNWLSCNDKGEVVLDKEAMSEWIEEFCLRYKTVGKKRNFTTHNGNVIQISGGDYGWRLDYEKIVKQVEAAITEKTDSKLIEAYLSEQSKKNQKALTTELEPTYSNKAYQKDYENFENDWDTQNYSEIDLTEQRVYVYRDGQLAYSCICVSGLPTEKNDRITRTGVWYIKEKKPEKVLVGEDYETPVKYWIRIMWTGTGYHALDRSDWANWTPDLYKVKGSHGCLNLQEEDAKKLYELIRMNDPVFIHY